MNSNLTQTFQSIYSCLKTLKCLRTLQRHVNENSFHAETTLFLVFMTRKLESPISWRKIQKYEHCAINTNKAANSIFTSHTMNELGNLMQYSYPLRKMFWPDKSIASRTGHDKVWVPFEKDCSLKETNENGESDVTVFVFFIYSPGSEPRTECTVSVHDQQDYAEWDIYSWKKCLNTMFKWFCSVIGKSLLLQCVGG